jgi:signal transduction histidine kinase
MARARILIVEDDINLLEGVQTVLELDGYSVVCAENGASALQVLRSERELPDLIVSDIMMPHMDGIQLLREVRKEPAWVSIPFIFLSARSEKADIRRGKQLGVDDYLVKPFDADDLLIAVESRLNRQKAIDEAQAGEMSELKRRILTILNHEFRTPLTFVVAYADMLNNQESYDLSDEEMLSFLKGVNTGANRLRRLIENFIQLVEMETGDAKRTYEIRRAPISNLDVIFREVCQTVLDGSDERPCQFEIEPDIPPFMGDETYLTLALVQLVDNAVKFSAPDAPIILGARADGDQVKLWVQDRGRGISPEEQAHIWDIFYQVDRPVYEDQGAGSGLAIVRGIIQMHGGTVELESQTGVGSTFTIALPAILY